MSYKKTAPIFMEIITAKNLKKIINSTLIFTKISANPYEILNIS